ncbi:hypothetical protein [Streptomyces sp. CoH27]|uniref:hypothetical protein n=1 Tax=Streptomyces sp. CoH27 TaxID=2875763 RepID=UPI001CD3CC8F|nr:hypothetical protein [Streptomyces sp. CoH27]
MDYAPDRDTDKPAGQREVHRVLEDTHTLTGRRKSDPVHTLRRILVHSTSNARGRQAARANRLARATEDLNKVQRGAGSHSYPTAEKITARIGVIARTRRVTDCLRTTITADEAGRPVLDWHFDQDALDAQEATDGWYALLTNLSPSRPPPRKYCCATRARPWSNAAATTSKAHSRSHRSSSSTTGASPLSSP